MRAWPGRGAVPALPLLAACACVPGCGPGVTAVPVEVERAPRPVAPGPLTEEEKRLAHAREEHAAGDYRKCIVLCDDLLETDPGNAGALRLSALSCLGLYRKEGLGTHLERAFGVAKGLLRGGGRPAAKGHMILGSIYEALEVHPLAARELEEALRIDPGLAQAKASLDVLRAASRGRFGVADDFFRAPHRVRIYRTLGKPREDPAGPDEERPAYYFVFTKEGAYVRHYEVLARGGRLVRAVERSLASPEPRQLCSLEGCSFLWQVKDRLSAIGSARSRYEEGKAALTDVPLDAPSGPAGGDLPKLVKAADAFEKACALDPGVPEYALALAGTYLRIADVEGLPARLRAYVLGGGVGLARRLVDDPGTPAGERRTARERLAFFYYHLHAVPLCLEALEDLEKLEKPEEAEPSARTRKLVAALRAMRQDSFAKEPSLQGAAAGEVLSYRCPARPPDEELLFDEHVFIATPKSGGGGIVTYTLTSQPLRGERRHYLFEHASGSSRLVRLFGAERPARDALGKEVIARLARRRGSVDADAAEEARAFWLLGKAEAELRGAKRALDEIEKEAGRGAGE